MNDIESLRKHLAKAFPDAQIRLTKPLHADGVWWLDVTHLRKQISIEWSAAAGFGITTSP